MIKVQFSNPRLFCHINKSFVDEFLINSYIVEYWFCVGYKICSNFLKWYFESDLFFRLWRFIPAKTRSFPHRQSGRAYLRAILFLLGLNRTDFSNDILTFLFPWYISYTTHIYSNPFCIFR